MGWSGTQTHTRLDLDLDLDLDECGLNDNLCFVSPSYTFLFLLLFEFGAKKKGLLWNPNLIMPTSRGSSEAKKSTGGAPICLSYANYASGTTPTFEWFVSNIFISRVYIYIYILEVIVRLWITCPRNDTCLLCFGWRNWKAEGAYEFDLVYGLSLCDKKLRIE